MSRVTCLGAAQAAMSLAALGDAPAVPANIPAVAAVIGVLEGVDAHAVADFQPGTCRVETAALGAVGYADATLTTGPHVVRTAVGAARYAGLGCRA